MGIKSIQWLPVQPWKNATNTAAFTTCNFQQFQATLTPDSLIITSDNKTETFPLYTLVSICIFDNKIHQRQQQRLEKRRRQLYWFILTPAILSLLTLLPIPYPLQVHSWIAAPFIAAIISSFIPVNTSGIQKQSGLLLEMQNSNRAFTYYSNHVSAQAITMFLLQLKEAANRCCNK